MARTAGIILALLGSIHLMITSAMKWAAISDWIGAGWWAASPGLAATDQAAGQFAAWLTIGSFGLPLLVLGLWIATARTAPAFVGWFIGGWAVLLATLLPLTPAWLVLIPAAMIIKAQHDKTSPDRQVATMSTME